MTTRLRNDRYRPVGAGKTWVLFWPQKAWVALSLEERIALIVDQQALFEIDRRSLSTPEKQSGQKAADPV
jgi:hypothetical protein